LDAGGGVTLGGGGGGVPGDGAGAGLGGVVVLGFCGALPEVGSAGFGVAAAAGPFWEKVATVANPDMIAVDCTPRTRILRRAMETAPSFD